MCWHQYILFPNEMTLQNISILLEHNIFSPFPMHFRSSFNNFVNYSRSPSDVFCSVKRWFPCVCLWYVAGSFFPFCFSWIIRSKRNCFKLQIQRNRSYRVEALTFLRAVMAVDSSCSPLNEHLLQKPKNMLYSSKIEMFWKVISLGKRMYWFQHTASFLSEDLSVSIIWRTCYYCYIIIIIIIIITETTTSTTTNDIGSSKKLCWMRNITRWVMLCPSYTQESMMYMSLFVIFMKTRQIRSSVVHTLLRFYSSRCTVWKAKGDVVWQTAHSPSLPLNTLPSVVPLNILPSVVPLITSL